MQEIKVNFLAVIKTILEKTCFLIISWFPGFLIKKGELFG